MIPSRHHIASVFKNYLVVAFSLLLLFQQSEAIAETVHDEEIELVQNTTLESIRTGVFSEGDASAESVLVTRIVKNVIANAETFTRSSTYYLFYRALLL